MLTFGRRTLKKIYIISIIFLCLITAQDYALTLDGLDDYAQMDNVVNFNDEITIDLEFEYYDDTDGIIIGKMRYGSDCSFYIGMNPGNEPNGYGRIRWGFKTEAMGSSSDLYFDTPESLNQYQRYRLTATYNGSCLLYTSPSPRDVEESRMPSSA